MRFVLNGHTPVREKNLLRWAKWLEHSAAERQVALTELGPGVHVSTVFVGLDHDFHGRGAARLFETKIFGGTLHGEQWRYATWTEAEAGHAHAVACAKNAVE